MSDFGLVEPIAVRLERIGRQRHTARLAESIEADPVDFTTRFVELPERGQHRPPLLVAKERRQPGHLGVGAGLTPKREQCVAGSDFDEVISAGGRKRDNGVAIAHRPQCLLAPVIRSDAGDRLSGKRGNPFARGSCETDSRSEFAKCVDRGLHLRGVEGVRYRKPLGCDIARAAFVQHADQFGFVTRDDSRLRRVDRRQSPDRGIVDRLKQRRNGGFVGGNRSPSRRAAAPASAPRA